MATQTRWILKSVPGGGGGEGGDALGSGNAESGKLPGYKKPAPTDFEAVTEPMPTEDQLSDGEVLYKHQYLSPDPYVAAYCMGEGFVGKTITAGAAGVVLASKSDKFQKGDYCVGNGGAAEASILHGDKLRKISSEEGSAVPFDPAQIPISAACGILGMPGATSYFATRDNLGADLTGQTIVVTGAVGAVGSAAGQLAKIFGAAKVIGFAGSDAKCATGKEKYGFDVMLNYKTADVGAELDAFSPIHGFFDNTGGPVALRQLLPLPT